MHQSSRPPLSSVTVPGHRWLLGVALVLVALLCLLPITGAVLAAVQDVPTFVADEPGLSWARIVRVFQIFLVLCVLALVLLIGTVGFLLWHAKKLVETAVKPNLPKLEKSVERIRQKHPDLSEDDLAKKLIYRQSNLAGLVGLVTGIGGLPTLPITIPIDIAISIKLQSNLVHMLRILHGEHVSAKALSETSLWLITTGGQELTAASSVLIRDLAVKSLSKSLLKFLPLLGGVVGYGLNWVSTQALGRLTLEWMQHQDAGTVA
jgi:hypothetical protein